MICILTADWHLSYPEGRGHRPPCRLDPNWIETQRKALNFITETAIEEHIPIIIAGDIFDAAKVPPIVSNLFEDVVRRSIGINLIGGNHDFKYGNLSLVSETSIYPFINLKVNSAISFTDYGQEPKEAEIMVLHTLTFKNEKEKGMAKGTTAQELLDKYPTAKWIFVGDNHRHFHYEKDGRHVVNPGCILRFTADLINYQPVICFINTDLEIVKAIPVPDNLSMVTDGYLRKEEAREGNIEAFIEKVQSKTGLTLSFTDNLKQTISEDKIEKGVVDIINQIAEKAGVHL